MNITNIKETNCLYTKRKEELHKEWEKLKDTNNSINIDEFKNLQYEEMKEIIGLINYRCDNSTKTLLDSIYKRKRNNKYPELNHAIYYPELNKIDFLTKEKIKVLDSILVDYKIGACVNHLFQRNIVFETEVAKKILEFMYENKIVIKIYNFKCDCGYSGKCINEEEYNKLLRIFNTPIDKRTEEDCENAYLGISCIKCDEYKEIESKEEFEATTVIIEYELAKAADRTKDSL